MSWQSRGPTAADPSIAPIDLRTLAGLAGQLLYNQEIRSNQLTCIPCRVLSVDRSTIALELPAGAPRPDANSAVILEVLHRKALVQCFTSVIRTEPGAPLMLRLPARPHVIQRRRHPRVDLFLGVSLHTPERPIEEIPAQMINLSVDGAACVVAEPLTPGSGVTINMGAMGLQPPRLSGRVVRCVPAPTHLWVIGVQFEQVSPEQEECLAQYIAGYLQRAEGPLAP